MEPIKKYLKELRDMDAEVRTIADNYEEDYGGSLDQLEMIQERAERIAEKVWDFEEDVFDPNGPLPPTFLEDSHESLEGKNLYRRITKNIEKIKAEIHGYDERGIMEMMYPNEDIDSEDFENGFDLEDFYEED